MRGEGMTHGENQAEFFKLVPNGCERCRHLTFSCIEGTTGVEVTCGEGHNFLPKGELCPFKGEGRLIDPFMDEKILPHNLILDPNARLHPDRPRWRLTVSNKTDPLYIKICVENPPIGMADALEKVLHEYIPY